MTCQPASSSPYSAVTPPMETAADARPPRWDQEMSSPAITTTSDARMPTAGKEISRRATAETPFHPTTNHHEARRAGRHTEGNSP